MERNNINYIQELKIGYEILILLKTYFYYIVLTKICITYFIIYTEARSNINIFLYN